MYMHAFASIGACANKNKQYMQRSDTRLSPKAFARTQTRQPGPAAAQHPAGVQNATPRPCLGKPGEARTGEGNQEPQAKSATGPQPSFRPSQKTRGGFGFRVRAVLAQGTGISLKLFSTRTPDKHQAQDVEANCPEAAMDRTGLAFRV